MKDKNIIDITIPDIGDTENVSIIEILVSVGDKIAVDDSLLTLESDKASMEVPASHAGIIQSLTANIGDSVNVGDVIGQLELQEAAPGADETPAEPDAEETSPQPQVEAEKEVETQEEPAKSAQPSTTAPAAKQTSNSPTAHLDDDKQRPPHASPGAANW